MPASPFVLSPADALLVQQLQEAALRYDESRRADKASICRDIARRTIAYGRFASERQRGYAEALVRWSMPAQGTPVERQQQQVRQEAAAERAQERSAQRNVAMGSTLTRITQLFAVARANGLRFPKIRLQRGEWKIRIYPAPSTGRHPGNFYVKASSATSGRNEYMGRIDHITGQFLPHPACPLDVITALREFAEAPERVATAYGHATGHCCFCGLGLTDSRSVAMGYGPICAEHYGLPWGEQRAEQSVTVTVDPAIYETSRAGLTMQEFVARQQRRAQETRPSSLAVSMNPPRALSERLREMAARRERPRPVHPAAVDDSDEDSHFM